MQNVVVWKLKTAKQFFFLVHSHGIISFHMAKKSDKIHFILNVGYNLKRENLVKQLFA